MEKIPGRLKIGKNIEFKLLLKGCSTFLKYRISSFVLPSGWMFLQILIFYAQYIVEKKVSVLHPWPYPNE